MSHYNDALRDLVSFLQFKKHKKNHGGVLYLVVKLQASAKINTRPCVLFMFFKLYKWY